MQDAPLTLVHFFDRAERLFTGQDDRHRDRRPAASGSPTASGPSAPAGWAACSTTSASPPTAGSPRSPGTPPATWSCTSPRPCTGRVLHTLNIRLFPEQLTYIVNHAEDEVIFVDRSLLRPAAAAAADVRDRQAPRASWTTARARSRADPAGCRAARLRGAAGRRRAGRVRTSTTRTGRRRCATRAAPPATPRASSTATARRTCTPSAAMTADSLGVRRARRRSCRSCRCSTPTPGAWPTPRVASGADLVMPGPDLSPTGASPTSIVEERVTVAAGVPTIWMGVLPELEGRDTSSLRAIPCGGSAVPKALSEALPRAARPAASCRPGA